MNTSAIAAASAARPSATRKLLLLTAILPLGFTSAAWSQTHLDPIGGSGGSRFESRCPPGEYLHGFEIRVGDDVDAIRPICFAPAGQGERIAPGKYAGAWYGGTGGRIQQLHCPANQGVSAIVGMGVASEGITEVVNEIRLFCGPVSSQPFQLGEPAAVFKGREWKGDGGIFGSFSGYRDQTQRCPDGDVAVGLHGRTGLWVDAIGLICDAPAPDRGFAELARTPPPVPLGRVQPKPLPVPLGRKQPTPAQPDPLERKPVPMSVILNPPPICLSAQSARGRNSPAAPGLERQCQVAMEQAAAAARAAPPPVAAPSVPPPASPPPVAIPPVASGPGTPSSICDAAREARYYNSPDAYALEAQCRAQGGASPGPIAGAPYPPIVSRPSPICEAARRALYNNSPDADRLEALCRAGSDIWGQPGTRRPLSISERTEVLDVHNQQRPDFQRLQWDVALEDSAARWAAQLAASGRLANDYSLRGMQGENLYMAVPSGRYTFGDISRIWASERVAFRPGVFPDVTGYGSPTQVINYTQMIWADTTHVGCAVERTPRADFFVCRYAPAGNIPGTAVR